MKNNIYDYEAAKKIINDDVNVTEKNTLFDLGRMLLKLIITVIFIYFTVFVLSGILLKTMSEDKKVQLENLLSSFIPVKYEVVENNYDVYRIKKIRNYINSYYKDSLNPYQRDITIIKIKPKNAFCLPNGNIYISKSLYDDLTDDEMLTFVIAHEISHYKNRDHLMSLRKSFASMTVLILLSVTNPNNQEIVKFVSTGLDLGNMHNSRKMELKADEFAIETLDGIYGNHQAGVRVLELFKDYEKSKIDVLSDHPNLSSRIKFIKQYR